MNDRLKKRWNSFVQILYSFLTCVIIGIVGGLFGSLFHYLLDFAGDLRTVNSWLIFLLPVGGIIIALLFKKANIGEYFNTEKVYHDAKKSEKVSFWLAPVIYLASFITHLFGGSAGREGASIAIGGSIGSDFSRLLKHPNEKRYMFIIAGMSAAFGGILAIPITAAVFGVESTILYRKKGFKRTVYAFICSAISSFVGYLMALLLKVEPLNYGKHDLSYIDFKTVLFVIVLILMTSAVSIIFKLIIQNFRHFYNKINNFYLRIFSGGVFVVCITLLISTQKYSGAGGNLIFDSFFGTAESYDFILKLILTAFTMGCGFCGGEMIPTMAIGASFGFACSLFLPLPLEIAVCVSLITAFSTFMKSPLSGFVLAFEIFGFSGWHYYIIVLLSALTYTLLISKFKKTA